MSIFDDFSTGSPNSNLWKAISGGTVRSAFAGRKQSLTFDGEGIRLATTFAVNTLNFNALSFDLIHGDGSNGGSRNTNHVSLQYSTNQGATWSTLETYPTAANWTAFKVDLPSAAQTNSTLIRWLQNDSGATLAAGSNAWALDNIRFNLSYIPGSATAKGVNFGRTARGDYAVRNGGDIAVPITFAGRFASDSQPGSGWAGVVASPSGKDYKFYLKNAGTYARWRLDVSGALTSSSFLSEAELFYEEADIAYDINGDGTIGLPYTPGRKSVGDVNLGTTALGYAIRKGAAAAVQVTFAGKNASATNPGSNWAAVAATAGSGGAGYTLYWKNSSSGAFSRWRLDDSGSLSTSAFLSTSELYTEEQNLRIDLDDDGKIGLIFQAGSTSIGGVTIGATPLGYALKKGSGSEVQVSLLGKAVSDSYPGSGWSAVAAAAGAGPGSGYRLYWRHQGTGRFSRWHLDDSGAHAASSFLSEVELAAEEKMLGHDLNNDGRVGLAFSPGIATIGSTTLGTNALGYAVRYGNRPEVQVTVFGQVASSANPGSTWTAVAAEGSDSGFDLYWRHGATGQMSKWELSSSGQLESSEFLSPRKLYKAESRLAYDLDRDGITGIPTTVFATAKGVGLANSAIGYCIKPAEGAAIAITAFEKDVSANYPGGGWRAIAAATPTTPAPGVAYDLYWVNNLSKAYAKWSLNSAGASIGSSLLGAADVLGAERAIGFDLSSNGVIGSL